MEAVAAPDQADSDDVVRNQLAEILARLLQHQEQYDELLRPVARLEEVVRLHEPVIRSMWKALVHGRGVEVPDRRAAHDPQAKRSVKAKVHSCICLLHEAGLLRPALDAIVYRDGSYEPLHAKFSREAQDNDIEAHKCEVACAFTVVGRCFWVRAHIGRYKRVICGERV